MRSNYPRAGAKKYFTDNDSFDTILQLVDADLTDLSVEVLGQMAFGQLVQAMTQKSIADFDKAGAALLSNIDFYAARASLWSIISAYFNSKIQEIFEATDDQQDPRISTAVDLCARWYIDPIDLGYDAEGKRKLLFHHYYFRPEELEPSRSASFKLHHSLHHHFLGTKRRMLQ